MASAEKLDPQHRGGRPIARRLVLAGRSRDVIIPGLKPAFISAGAICFATAMGAFGTAFTLATDINVLPMTIYTEFTLRANIAIAAALSVVLGAITWWCSRSRDRRRQHRRGGGLSHAPNRPLFCAQLGFTLLVCAFMFVPVVLSMHGGLHRELHRGFSERADLALGRSRCGRSTATRSAFRSSSRSRASRSRWSLAFPPPTCWPRRTTGRRGSLEELLVTPVAVPGLAIALGLIITYGGVRRVPHALDLHPGRPRAVSRCRSWCARFSRC